MVRFFFRLSFFFFFFSLFLSLSLSLSLFELTTTTTTSRSTAQKQDRVGNVYRGGLLDRETWGSNIHLGLVETRRGDAIATDARESRERFRVAVCIGIGVGDAKRESEPKRVLGGYGWFDEEDGRERDDYETTTATATKECECEYFRDDEQR